MLYMNKYIIGVISWHKFTIFRSPCSLIMYIQVIVCSRKQYESQHAPILLIWHIFNNTSKNQILFCEVSQKIQKKVTSEVAWQLYIICSHSRMAKLSGIFIKVHAVHCIQSYDTAGSLFSMYCCCMVLAKFKESID